MKVIFLLILDKSARAETFVLLCLGKTRIYKVYGTVFKFKFQVPISRMMLIHA
jgi:hypothetical protein